MRALFVLALAGCHPDVPGDEPVLHVGLTGAVAKGPFVRGSSVSVAPLDAAGVPSGDVFLTETNDDAGRFALDVDVPGPVRMEAEGYYYNEVTGQLSTAPITLRSYHAFGEGGDQVAFINLFTHLSSERVKALQTSGTPIDDALTEAENEAALQLHVGPATFSPSRAGGAMDLLGGDDDDDAYLFALSTVIAEAAWVRAGADGPVDATLTEMVNGIASDLADGILDGGPGVPTGPELYELQSTIDADAVMAMLGARFASIGVEADVPDLHRVFDLDRDGIVDRDDADGDGDGHDRVADGGDDCADNDAAVHPGAPEDFTDGVDVDCTADTDGDGHLAPEAGGDDCDDGDAATHLGADELWYDGIDQDCAGDDDFDQDRDGVVQSGDCDDTEPTVSPRLTETWYDGIDEDCAGDDDFDQDHDGSVLAVDCDDVDPTSHPGATELWYDGIDEDCLGNDDLDQDGDGHRASAHGGNDCDDLTATTHPGAVEVWYDGIDADCAGDDDFDQDHDGVLQSGDCDDTEPTVSPRLTETWYDGIDEDCAGDDDFDQDHDGSVLAVDCDDVDPTVYPGAPELCDAHANDCDTWATWGSSKEDGLASWVDSAGARTDLTSEVAGTWASPVTWTVPADGEADFCRGTFFVGITLSGGFNTTFVGLQGASQTTLDAAGAGSVFTIVAGSPTIRGLTLAHGYAGSGGAINVVASPNPVVPSVTVADCDFVGNLATNGGAIYMGLVAQSTISGCSFSGNEATYGGGALFLDSAGVTIERSTFDGETSPRGAAILIEGASMGRVRPVVISDSTFTNNVGGALRIWAPDTVNYTTVITGSTFALNQGTAIDMPVGALTLDRDTFMSNASPGWPTGGALTQGGGTTTCTGATAFEGNAGAAGGAVYLASTAGISFTSNGCIFGGTTPNTPNDVTFGVKSYGYGGAATFTCDRGTCR